MKLKNHDVIQGDTLVITTQFEAISNEGKLQEFLIGTRVELVMASPTEVTFSYAARTYQADASYFVTVDHWFHLRNQMKYLEEDRVVPKPPPPPAIKLVNSSALIELSALLIGVALMIWLICLFVNGISKP